MAITPVGNMTYIHQNAPVSSAIQSSSMHRGDVASIASLQELEKKQREIEEAQKVDDLKKLDPDRDGAKQSFSDQSEGEGEQEEEHLSDHILDISV